MGSIGNPSKNRLVLNRDEIHFTISDNLVIFIDSISLTYRYMVYYCPPISVEGYEVTGLIPTREVIKEEMDCVKGIPPFAFYKPCATVA